MTSPNSRRGGAEEKDWFEERTRYDNDGIDEEDEEYQEFVEKFKIKKTSDDCYTPDQIYDTVAGWVAAEYGIKQKNFVRPFYPGADYKKSEYKKQDVVVDNPPFSILSEIVKFYTEKGVRFFLFAPTLTIFSSASSEATSLVAYADITYENGATIKTSFITNLEDKAIRAKTVPALTRAIIETNKALLREQHRELPKYSYPDNVITAAMIGQWSFYGVNYELRKRDSKHIRALDEQKERGKAIFGSGFLISEKAAAEKAAAEKTAAEKTAAEKWALSEREMQIIKQLGDDKEPVEEKNH